MEKSGFFADVDGKNEYTDEFLADWVASFIGNGVYNGSLAVIPAEGMAVTVQPGKAWINGRLYCLDSPKTIPLEMSDGKLSRYTSIMIRSDKNELNITAKAVDGDYSEKAVAPNVTRNSEIYDLDIADVYVAAGTIQITQSQIADRRPDNDVCGIVTGVIDQVDTSTLSKQFEAWYSEYKDVLTDEAKSLIQGLKDEIADIEQGSEVMLRAVYDPDGDGRILDDSKLPLTGGTLTGPLYAPQYAVSGPDGSYWLDAGDRDGKAIHYRLHANDGALWLNRQENGEVMPVVPLQITSAGYCMINGRAATAEWAERAGYADSSTTAETARKATGNTFMLGSSNPNAGLLATSPTLLYVKCDAVNDHMLCIGAYGGVYGLCTNGGGVGSLGNSNSKWREVWATSGTIQTSDRNEKNSIAELEADQAQAFVAALRPVTYKYNDGTSGRTHWGLIAQDVEEAMAGSGLTDMDFAGFIRSPKMEKYETGEIDADGNLMTDWREIPGEYTYSLRYEEFVAPLIAAVQAQQKQIAALEKRLKKLENRQ